MQQLQRLHFSVAFPPGLGALHASLYPSVRSTKTHSNSNSSAGRIGRLKSQKYAARTTAAQITHRPALLRRSARHQYIRTSAMQREEPGPGQESVWDYPRPPRLEPVPERITVELGGKVCCVDRMQGVTLSGSYGNICTACVCNHVPFSSSWQGPALHQEQVDRALSKGAIIQSLLWFGRLLPTRQGHTGSWKPAILQLTTFHHKM